jgi:hypothetical protein
MRLRTISSGATIMVLLLSITGVVTATAFHATAPLKPMHVSSKRSTQAEFDYLSRQTSNSCGLLPATVMSDRDSMRLQGSCCSPMTMSKYIWQLHGLRSYSRISAIPSNPYDVSARLAKRLLRYEHDIHLTSQQKRGFRHAMQMTADKGPCCCHCWRWNTTTGLAEYLIVHKHLSAVAIAHIVDLVNGCGGSRKG